MTINSKMKQILNMQPNYMEQVAIFMTLDDELINPNFSVVHGCTIIDNEKIFSDDNVNIQRVLKMFGDKTGYEASVNELRINDYINKIRINDIDIVSIGIKILKSWRRKLKTINKNQKFNFVLSFNEGNVTIRTHVLRDNERGWLDDDLEKYNEAILVFS